MSYKAPKHCPQCSCNMLFKIIILIDKQQEVNSMLKLVNYNKTNYDLERLREKIIGLF